MGGWMGRGEHCGAVEGRSNSLRLRDYRLGGEHGCVCGGGGGSARPQAATPTMRVRTAPTGITTNNI
jgi:hypothetical protein